MPQGKNKRKNGKRKLMPEYKKVRPLHCKAKKIGGDGESVSFKPIKGGYILIRSE